MMIQSRLDSASRAARPLLVLAMVALGVQGSTAHAGQLVPDFKNENTIASYLACFSAVIDSDTEATLMLEVQNTTPGNGVLTALGFNLPDFVSSIAVDTSSFTTNNEFSNLNTPGDFGTFDYGLSTGSPWQAGSTAAGVPAGDTGLFSFDLTGSFAGVSAAQLVQGVLSSFSQVSGNELASIFVARFQGVGVGGQESDTQVSLQVIPEPSTLALSGLAGLAGLGLAIRRRVRR